MVLVILGRVLRQEKEIKGAQIRKEVKLFFIFSHMILHTENPKDSTKTLAVLINQFNKATVHKNQHKEVSVFLYTNNETFKKK